MLEWSMNLYVKHFKALHTITDTYFSSWRKYFCWEFLENEFQIYKIRNIFVRNF